MLLQNNGQGGGASSNTAETTYNNSAGVQVNLWYKGVQIATLQRTSDGYYWPIISAAYPSACGCCDLCRAQPNNQSQESGIDCLAWSFRSTDRACRLWNNANQTGNGLSLETSTSWVSGVGENTVGDSWQICGAGRRSPHACLGNGRKAGGV